MNGRVASVRRMDLGGTGGSFIGFWWSNQEAIGVWSTPGEAVAGMLALGFSIIPGGSDFAMGPDMRSCDNTECWQGQIVNPDDPEDYKTCTICQGTTVLFCECGRGVAENHGPVPFFRCCRECVAEETTVVERAAVAS